MEWDDVYDLLRHTYFFKTICPCGVVVQREEHSLYQEVFIPEGKDGTAKDIIEGVFKTGETVEGTA